MQSVTQRTPRTARESVLIVNADDFGYNSRINAAIVASFENGFCSSTTLMANMPGFEEACELTHAHRLIEHVGLHLNLSEGEPLTDAIRRCARFCDHEGRFRLVRDVRTLRLDAQERRDVATEIRAQIQRLRDRGIRITHLDSHKHLHEELGVFKVTVPLIKEAGIPSVRRLRNIGRSTSTLKWTYRALLNARLAYDGLARTHYFGSMADYGRELSRRGGSRVAQSCEIMIHPDFDMHGKLIDFFTHGMLANDAMAFGYSGLAVSYSGKRYGERAKLSVLVPGFIPHAEVVCTSLPEACA